MAPWASGAGAARRHAEAVVGGEALASRFTFSPSLLDKGGRRFCPADKLCGSVERLPQVEGPLAGELILCSFYIFFGGAVLNYVR